MIKDCNNNIYIDLSIAHINGGFVSGAGEYALKVCSLLIKENVNLLIGLSDKNKYPSLSWLLDNQTVIKYSDFTMLSEILVKRNINTVYFPQLLDEHILLKLPESIRVVATLHDLGNILEYQLNKFKIPGYFYEMKRRQLFKHWLRKKIYSEDFHEVVKKQTDVLNHFKNLELITVSHFSKATIRYYIPDYKKNIEVLYSPQKKSKISDSEGIDKSIKDKFKIEEHKYFLFCNVSRPRKNCTIAILALDDFFSTVSTNYKAVLVGSCPEYSNFILKQLKNKDKFVFMPYLQSEKLEDLYKFAHLFVFPSVLEGFGYPPIEAMKYGTLCACSNVCSIPEVCQNGAILFNPYDVKSIKIAYHLSLDKKFADYKREEAKVAYKNISARQEGDLEELIKIIKK